MEHKVLALRLTPRPAIRNQKGEIIDDGTNNAIQLTSCKELKYAEIFADNVRKNVRATDWKVWIE